MRCAGPQSPLHHCSFQREGACRFWEWSDLLIYDPWLDNGPREANSSQLVSSLRRTYPERPLILAGREPVTPTWVEHLTRSDPLVAAVFPASREALLETVSRLLLLSEQAMPMD